MPQEDILMRPLLSNPSIPGRRAARTLGRTWPLLIVAAVGLGHVAASARSDAAPGSLSPQCEAWDTAATVALTALIADRREIVEAQLGDALFRLRRARKNCRHDWTGLARLDYDALTDGRYGRTR
jgi:hypothetical protein